LYQFYCRHTFPFCFGTIKDMNLCRSKPLKKLFAIGVLTILWLTTSCAPNLNLLPDSVSSGLLSPTPFQPQSALSSLTPASPVPQTESTYTPVPTQHVAAENLSAPTLVDLQSGNSAGDSNPLKIYDPLTGLPVSDPSLLNRRPMVIKVANSPDYVRPQSGLTLADVVYEYYIEWGDTRFIAVMYGNDSPMVGPVRSGRYFDEHVARMYNAYLAFKGADPRELSYLEDSTLKDFLIIVYSFNSNCPPIEIGPERRDSYNNAFFNTTKWAACAAKKGLDNTKPILRGGFFSDQAPDSTTLVKRIFSFFSGYNYSYWDYDPATHKYFRYQEANDLVSHAVEKYTPLTDLQTGLPVTTENVVLLYVPYTFGNQFDAHDQVYHIDLVDSGDAYVFRDGVAMPARWVRTDINQPLLLTTVSGSPIYLRPGHTFYEVMGVNSTLTQNGTDWHFEFKTP